MCTCVCWTCIILWLLQGVYISDDVLRRTYLEPENQEDKDEVVRHPDLDGERNKHIHVQLLKTDRLDLPWS